MQTDVGKYMESIGFPNDGAFRSHTHEVCFRAVVIWRDCMDDDQFAIPTVPLIHMWNADGAPGNIFEEKLLRPMRLDYTESEIFQILRRYQGPADSEATPHAKQRMALCQIMEKYNSISRNV
ncbi:hypothetical protein [Streptomyces xantholiticus]|uniref:hypothetical protein n=1 Tax=Streptomyces xantholiticus TaxID=68285 RepID=UPI0019A727EB|nr:hypothetical protein [Streptomyces xantholiticus]GGW48460.1 hypothetical protein GCM10010381_37320 [Streptomyces xantholiticus]